MSLKMISYRRPEFCFCSYFCYNKSCDFFQDIPQLVSDEIICCDLTYIRKMSPTLKYVTHPQPRPQLCKVRYPNFPLTRKMNTVCSIETYQLSSLKVHKICIPLPYYTSQQSPCRQRSDFSKFIAFLPTKDLFDSVYTVSSGI